MNARQARAVATAREVYIMGARDIEEVVLKALAAYEPIGVVEIAAEVREQSARYNLLTRVQ